MKLPYRFLSVLLSLIVVFSVCPQVMASDRGVRDDFVTIHYDIYKKYPAGVEGFIARLYDLVMGRSYDQEGLDYWKGQLDSGSMNASNIARFFFSCDEYYSLGYSLDDYITVLYKVFFDRKPDSEGFNYWKGLVLNNGKTRRDVLEGFINSQEWADVCIRFGVVSGTGVQPSYSVSRPQGVTDFVNSLYKDVLGRDSDKSGLDFWCDSLTYMTNSAKSSAKGFFDSDEFKALYKSKSDEDRVKVFYKVFLGREAEGDGLDYWKGQIKGKSVKEGISILFNGFVDSPEFADKCKKLGIIVNMPNPTPVYKAPSVITYTVETSSGTKSYSGYLDKELALNIMDATNAYRVSLGLPELSVNKDLIKATDIRVVELCYSFSHTRPNGGKFNSANPSCTANAENIAAGYGTMDASFVLNSWKSSSGHNKNMTSSYNSIGVSVFVPSGNTQYGSYFIQQFKY